MKIVKTMGNGDSASKLLELFAKKWPEHKWPALLQGIGYKIIIESLHKSHSNEQQRGFFVLIKQWYEMDDALKTDVLPLRVHNEPEKVQLDELRNQVYMFHFGKLYVTDHDGNEIEKPVRTTTRYWSWKHGTYLPDSLSMELYSTLIERVYHLAAERGIVLPSLERKDDTHQSA